MVSEVVQTGLVTGIVGSAIVALRAITQFIVVVWSFRADEAGRRHALRLLDALRLRSGSARSRRHQ
ncbi:hypothetical protein [Amycolatopsis aidingensis]|uniref:hypothetical protein n=1 Tax=Amycolatopsis aidingensis TaxID=2842453 RepID=UPI001C0C0639|nr:hypothetical protein [Amycolatopsis aidingensis]